MQGLAAALDSFRAQAEPLVADGVEVLVPGGGIAMSLFANERDFSVAGAPIVNGILILIKMTQAAVGLKRLNGRGLSGAFDMIILPAYVIEALLGR